MSITLNETHDAGLRSWVTSANAAGTDFPIQNLPYGVFRRKDGDETFRAGVAIGDSILDLRAAFESGAFAGFGETVHKAIVAATTGVNLNPLMELDVAAWSALRLALSTLLREGAVHQSQLQSALVPQAEAEQALPAQIGDYTDFYTSIHHATAIGKLFRPDNPLLPNYKWVPIGYHGRSSSIAVSGQQFRRPLGQLKPPTSDVPVFDACKRLDYEMEVGVFMGQGNAIGDAIAIGAAESHVFGLCLLNDWSARDVQAWEYQPLGPFLAKNFASTISPWIVTLEALAPYRAAWTRDAADPQPLAYLDAPDLREHGAFDVQLEVLLQTKAMREAGTAPQRLSLGNFRDAYWTVSQLVAHHTVGGCNLRAGDLLGSGTLSGPTPESAGSLLELTAGGKQSINLDNGETRIFIEDGDTVIMRGWAGGEGLPRIGFGEVAGTVLPARQV
ncbi:MULTISPECIES: fumarylacetoacetase [unclassified Herbaspirillum]|uniref:fumarylacetoacetase n=1 Tax=unclassified Herbaspirillum TaxID=2624150 RepID=UPI000E2F3C63|nr:MULTISPECIES: fumarylacetoacetase [unclassified Herbaspirillum]RFB65632.1 fumarylacetoacetase [Herbaspirillum sp. 3R-3a1]TFI09064.1 fumarylacetoacetase [Herbaspirillum sp. 3R11]TFI15482.1 fumarylacetoacetase [Herbaspirillum sp. 3R-11]TFI31746.1 fumarylacetoacetase [Herbaspirillum sp. 3C11]